jgi:hypothetical protein
MTGGDFGKGAVGWAARSDRTSAISLRAKFPNSPRRKGWISATLSPVDFSRATAADLLKNAADMVKNPNMLVGDHGNQLEGDPRLHTVACR